MAIPIPDDVRELLQAPNYVHLSTPRADGSPRNWVVWAGPEDDHVLALPYLDRERRSRVRGEVWPTSQPLSYARVAAATRPSRFSGSRSSHRARQKPRSAAGHGLSPRPSCPQ